MTEIIGEVIDEDEAPGALAVYRPQSPTLFGTDDPVAVIEKASTMAQPLAALVDKQKLYTNISGRKHVRVEGWTLLGSMLGVFAVCVWTRKLENGWEARVEARTRDGSVVGAAEAECLRSERTWANRDEYALRSMAQTRATSKALRQPLGFVMQLAGFDPTPAEEMPASQPAAKNSAEKNSSKPKPSAEDRKRFDDVLADLKAKAGHRDWAEMADKAARRDFGHGIGALSKSELETLTGNLSAHLATLKDAA